MVDDGLVARTCVLVLCWFFCLPCCVQDSASSTTTMKMPPPSLSSDLVPFFQRDYVKANLDDVLKAFPRMLTDMALTLPTEVCYCVCGGGVGVWKEW